MTMMYVTAPCWREDNDSVATLQPTAIDGEGAGVGPAYLLVWTRVWRGREPSRTRCAIQTLDAPGSLNSN